MNINDMKMPVPDEGMVITVLVISNDVEKSRDFYRDVLGGEVVFDGPPYIIKLANTWIIINTGGGETADKPGTRMAVPDDQNSSGILLNLRVANIQQVYKEWKSRGAQFLTEPVEHPHETRAYLRDPDGYLIEVGQFKIPADEV